MVGGEERGVGEDADYHRCWEAEGVGVICKGYLDEMMTLQHDRASDENFTSFIGLAIHHCLA